MITIRTWREYYRRYAKEKTLDIYAEQWLFEKLLGKDRDKVLDELIRVNLPIVHYVVNKYKWCNISYEDLVQYGIMGIISAADNFDFSKNTKFSTFSYHYILGRIRRALELHNNLIRLPAHINLSMGKISHLDIEENITKEQLEECTDKRYKLDHLEKALQAKRQKIIDLEEIFDIKDQPDNIDRKIVVEKLISIFTPREQKIIELKFGFNGYHIHTFKEIDSILNFDSEQIFYHAIRRVRRDYDLLYLLELLNDE